MQCKELETVLADELDALSPEAREHLAGCSACRELRADFSAILGAAKTISPEVNPPERIWVSLRAQLEAEGILRDGPTVETLATEPSWWSGFAEFFRPRALATAAVGMVLVAGSIYVVEQRQTSQTGTGQSKVTTSAVNPSRATDRSEPTVTKPGATALSTKQHTPKTESARTIVPPEPHISTGDLRPSPSETAYFGNSAAVLTETENAVPGPKKARNALVDQSLRQNLHTLNEFIAECEARLNEDPQNHMIREYLNMAYQQKAELLNAMLDSGRSEH